jgi:hypothetical protein
MRWNQVLAKLWRMSFGVAESEENQAFAKIMSSKK